MAAGHKRQSPLSSTGATGTQPSLRVTLSEDNAAVAQLSTGDSVISWIQEEGGVPFPESEGGKELVLPGGAI